MSFSIIGTGHCLPKFVLDNQQLTQMVDTSDEWIYTRTGIKSRFISTDETMTDLLTGAAQMALTASGLSASQLDLIIVSTVGGDYKTPSGACIVQGKIGADCPAFDINAACSGFIYALDMAAAYMNSGRAKNVLVLAAELMSKHVDWQDRATCVLFGDGAGGMVLTKGDGLKSIKITAKSNTEILNIGSNPGNSPFDKKPKTSEFLYMNGGEVFKFAVNAMLKDVEDVIAAGGITIDEVAKIIPHQANSRIIKSAQDKLKIAPDKIVNQIHKYGNTSSASIPILVSDLVHTGQLSKGDHIVLSAFGGGLTTGACLIKL